MDVNRAFSFLPPPSTGCSSFTHSLILLFPHLVLSIHVPPKRLVPKSQPGIFSMNMESENLVDRFVVKKDIGPVGL